MGSCTSTETLTDCPFRQPMGSDNIEITMEVIKLDYEVIYFEADVQDGYVDLDVFIDNLDENRAHYCKMHFILLDSLIGEYDAGVKIGDTKFYTLESETKSKLKSFLQLIDTLHNL